MKTMLIIDGHSLAHRAYHAVPANLTRADGVPTNAVLGFCNMLVKMLDDLSPDMVICAFDKAAPTFRHEEYVDYKAHRKPMDEELKVQLPLIVEACEAFGITVEGVEGYEADDVIGTIANRCSMDGIKVTIVTSDKDSLQLINDNVDVMLTKKGISEFERFDKQKFYFEYNFEPLGMIELKALMGDASDNIPGVKGIGEKTARKLVEKYGTIENLVNNIEEVEPARVKNLILSDLDSAYVSKRLATIYKEVPIRIDPFSAALEKNTLLLENFLKRQGFKSILNRLKNNMKQGKAYVEPEHTFNTSGTLFDMGADESVSEVRQEENVNVVIAKTINDVKELILAIKRSKNFCFEMITDYESPMNCKVLGLVVLNEDIITYMPLSETVSQLELGTFETIEGNSDIVPLACSEVFSLFADVFSNSSIEKLTHDYKSAKIICAVRGVALKGVTFDSMIASYLADSLAKNIEYADVVKRWLYAEVEIYKEAFRKDKALGDTRIDNLKCCEIAKSRMSYFRKLALTLEEAMRKINVCDLYSDMEMPLASVLADVEMCGVKIDIAMLNKISIQMQEKLALLIDKIYKEAGEEFNINSTNQLSKVLFEKIGLKPLKKTKTGYSTDSEVLEALKDKHVIVESILRYRALTKLKSTYVDALPKLVDKKTSRIHTTFNQTVTATGRLSSNNPNLQNIPVRTEEGREIRGAFVKRGEDWVIMSADYSQIELRILAHMSGDPKLISSFQRDEDVHTRTAAEIYNVGFDEVTREMRSNAKSVNFGIVYGISDFGLSKNINMKVSEAKEFITKYFQTYVGVKEFMERLVIEAKQNGFVTTLSNRRRNVPELYGANRKFGERIAMNMPIQGTAADIMKIAMINVHSKIFEKKLQSQIILQVHDELVLDVPISEISIIKDLLNTQMEDAMSLSIPLKVEIGYANSWLDAK